MEEKLALETTHEQRDAITERVNVLGLALQLGLLKLPQGRQFRKSIRHHLELENGAKFWVAISSTERLLLDDTDLDFMRWLVEKADSTGFVAIKRIEEFELSHGRRDPVLLEERVLCCNLSISVVYHDAHQRVKNNQSTMYAFQSYDADFCNCIWTQPTSRKMGVWIYPKIMSLMIEAQTKN